MIKIATAVSTVLQSNWQTASTCCGASEIYAQPTSAPCSTTKWRAVGSSSTAARRSDWGGAGSGNVVVLCVRYGNGISSWHTVASCLYIYMCVHYRSILKVRSVSLLLLLGAVELRIPCIRWWFCVVVLFDCLPYLLCCCSYSIWSES